MRTLLLLLCLAGCGARTDLGGSKSGGQPPCTKAPWILFDTQGGIGAIRSDATDRHLLALDAGVNAHARVPAMSPDGNSLVFIVFSDDGEQLLGLLDLPSGKRRTIAQRTPQPPQTGFGKAAVSYDNKWIAYGDSPDLHLVAFDDVYSNHVIVQGPFEEGCCPWSYGHPQFSADSSLIYYSTIGRLSSIRTDRSNDQLLYQDQFFANPTISGFVFPNVSLSNDGKRLVAQVACDVSELRIFSTSDLPTSDPCSTGTKLVETGISQASNEASNPAWGTADVIAYDDGADVFLIPAAGGPAMNLTQNGADAFAADPVWAPACANVP